MSLEEKNFQISETILEEPKKILTREIEQGKILITGGTEGIGNGIAEAFLMRGVSSVAICARTKEKIETMKKAHPEMIAERVDLVDRRAVKEFARKVIDDLGGIDALVLNAAIFDFDFKNKSLSKDEIDRKIFQVNEAANIALIREVREELKKSKGVVVFMTTRFISQSCETASAVDGQSAPAQEDIGRYIKSKKRIHEYLDRFIKNKQNEGVFVFSVIPGTVDTPANRRLIEVGTQELSSSKIKEREDGRERDKKIVGKIIAEMIVTRKKFNLETNQYDIPIENGEIVEISNAAVTFEKSKKL